MTDGHDALPTKCRNVEHREKIFAETSSIVCLTYHFCCWARSSSEKWRFNLISLTTLHWLIPSVSCSRRLFVRPWQSIFANPKWLLHESRGGKKTPFFRQNSSILTQPRFSNCFTFFQVPQSVIELNVEKFVSKLIRSCLTYLKF